MADRASGAPAVVSDSKVPFAAFKLKPDDFPLTMEAFRKSDGERVWSETITLESAEKLVMLRIPALKLEHGPVRMRFTYGDGEVVERE